MQKAPSLIPPPIVPEDLAVLTAAYHRNWNVEISSRRFLWNRAEAKETFFFVGESNFKFLNFPKVRFP